MSLYDRKKDCCGCEACMNACPKDVIRMKSDEEGFIYPVIENPEKCIHCNMCRNVCPVKQCGTCENHREDAFAGFLTDEGELKKSASGGLAYAMAKEVVLDGGVVYGCRYSNNYENAVFDKAETIAELEKFRTSKYIQAEKGKIYDDVKNSLKNGKKVLFIGLPCECNALKLFLGREWELLYVCSLICHGPTSRKVHKEYCRGLSRYGRLVGFSVRYKKDGWKPYYIKAEFDNGETKIEQFSESTYGTAFQFMKRPACNSCKIKRMKINSDLTIGDYHVAYGGKVKPYNFYGVSSAIVHTNKGRELLDGLQEFFIEPVELSSALYSGAYIHAIKAKANRKEFAMVFSRDGLDAACNLPSVKLIENTEILHDKFMLIGSKIKQALLNTMRR